MINQSDSNLYIVNSIILIMKIQRKLKHIGVNCENQNNKKQFQQLQIIKIPAKSQNVQSGQNKYALPWLLYAQHSAQKNDIQKSTMQRFLNKLLSPKIKHHPYNLKQINKQKPLLGIHLQQYRLFKDNYNNTKTKNTIQLSKQSYERSPNNISDEVSSDLYNNLIKSIKEGDNKFYKFIHKSIQIKSHEFVSPITLCPKQPFSKKNNGNYVNAAQNNLNEGIELTQTKSKQLKSKKSFSETKKSKILEKNIGQEIKQLKIQIQPYGNVKQTKKRQNKLKKISKQIPINRRDIFTPWKKQRQQQNIEQSLPKVVY